MGCRRFNIIRNNAMDRIIKVCSKQPIVVNSNFIVSNGKIISNNKINDTKVSNKVMTKKKIRNIRRGC